MNAVLHQHQRVLSAMRTTGRLHLGHYHGVLKNWLVLQQQYECFFFAADWHALTTHYATPEIIRESIRELFIDWLAVGIDPKKSCLFIQSQVPEHAELHVLLSMITPLAWLERVPSYKDQQQKIKDKVLDTYGFLGYPLLQAADILIYKASFVPVGEDQVSHIEFTREVSRRFNRLYGHPKDFTEQVNASLTKLGKELSKRYEALHEAFQERGDKEAYQSAKQLLVNQDSLSEQDREFLLGYLEGGGKVILPAPQVLLTPESKLPGTDGQKMSKSYNNTIGLREDAASVTHKIKTMPTDPARVRRTDPGDPGKCPVWGLHKVYSNEETKNWVQEGCKTAGIGCLQCKQPLIDAILKEQQPIAERAAYFENNPDEVNDIIREGAKKARALASKTLAEVNNVIGIGI